MEVNTDCAGLQERFDANADQQEMLGPSLGGDVLTGSQRHTRWMELSDERMQRIGCYD